MSGGKKKVLPKRNGGFETKMKKKCSFSLHLNSKIKIVIGRHVKIARYYFVIIEIRNFIQSILEIFGRFLCVKVNHVIIVRLI